MAGGTQAIERDVTDHGDDGGPPGPGAVVGTVLALGDDVGTLRTLASTLRDHGFQVMTGPAEGGALDELTLEEIDVVIVDLDGRAVDLCRHLRLRTRAPIIVMSNEDSDERKVATLDLGADDFLTWSVSVAELVARTRVAVRHRRALATVVDDELVQVGLLRMDLSSHQAMLVDRSLDLTVKEFTLLALLARNPGKVVTYRVLLAHVWGVDAGMDTLRTHVSHVRRKLGDHGGGIEILAEAGVGYRLEVEARDRPPAARTSDVRQDLETTG